MVKKVGIVEVALSTDITRFVFSVDVDGPIEGSVAKLTLFVDVVMLVVKRVAIVLVPIRVVARVVAFCTLDMTVSVWKVVAVFVITKLVILFYR